MILTFTFFFSINFSLTLSLKMVPEFYLLSIQLLNFLWILTFSTLSHPSDNFEFHLIFLYSFVTYTFVENGPRILTNLDPSPQLWLILTFFLLIWCLNTTHSQPTDDFDFHFLFLYWYLKMHFHWKWSQIYTSSS